MHAPTGAVEPATNAANRAKKSTNEEIPTSTTSVGTNCVRPPQTSKSTQKMTVSYLTDLSCFGLLRRAFSPTRHPSGALSRRGPWWKPLPHLRTNQHRIPRTAQSAKPKPKIDSASPALHSLWSWIYAPKALPFPPHFIPGACIEAGIRQPRVF